MLHSSAADELGNMTITAPNTTAAGKDTHYNKACHIYEHPTELHNINTVNKSKLSKNQIME